MEQIEQLKLSEIVRNPYQPRLVFDSDKLDELAESIKENGVLQPIIVRKSELIGYELLAGERRFQASKRAGQQTIPAIVRNYSDQEMMTLSILENLQRENLNPVEEAQSLSALANKLEMTHDQIAKSLGKSRSYVSNLIRLLGLPQAILQQVEAGVLSTAHGRTLLAEKDIERQLLLARRVQEEHLNVRQLEDLIYGSEKKEARSTGGHKDIFIADLEKELMKALGNTVTIHADKNYQGNLTVNFGNLNALETLIEKLKK